jgi:hypothetical protein
MTFKDLIPKRSTVMFTVGMAIIVWFAVDERDIGTEWLFIIGVLLGLPMLGPDQSWGDRLRVAISKDDTPTQGET